MGCKNFHNYITTNKYGATLVATCKTCGEGKAYFGPQNMILLKIEEGNC